MTNTTSWKNTFDKYLTAVNKPSVYNDKYKSLHDKYQNYRKQGNELETSILIPLSTEHIKFSHNGISFIINDKSVWDSSWISYSDIRQSFKYDIEMIKNVIGSIITKEIGTFAMNRTKNAHEYLNAKYYSDSSNIVTFDVISILVDDAKKVINKIDETFVENTNKIWTEVDALWNKFSRYEKAKESRDNNPYRLKNQTIRDWWNECGLTEGTRLVIMTSTGKYNGTEEVDYTKEGKNDTIIYFKSGYKAHKNNVDIERSFNVNNPRTDKNTWKTIFDVNRA